MHGDSLISDALFKTCQSQETVTSLLAQDPKLSPGEASNRLFGSHGLSAVDTHPPKERKQVSPEELERAYQCGRFGNTRPSELFLRVFHDSLGPIEHDKVVGVVSPSLVGTSGVLPLSIVSALPDICRHMANMIVRAQHEVFIATNYWKKSSASTLITDALRELSRRAGERGQKVVVKLVYDRGSVHQLIKNHLTVDEKGRVDPAIGLPPDHEIPNLHIEVVNFHRPMLGTFHAKFAVFDRKVALVMSCNIQDNDNMEMMTHLEGPVVDSLYDMALLTWHEALKPTLPLINKPANHDATNNTFETQSFLDLIPDFPKALVSKAKELNDSGQKLAKLNPDEPHYDADIAGEMLRMQSNLTPTHGERLMDLVTDHLNSSTKQTIKGTAEDCAIEDNMTPFVVHKVHDAFPMALVNRKPWGALNHSSVYVPQNEAWYSAIRNCQRTVFIQSPDINAEPLLPELLAAVRRGVEVTLYACLGYNDLGELLPAQGGTNEQIAHKLYSELDPGQRKLLKYYFYVGKDMTKPLHNKFKQRSCHIKLLICDEHLGISGSGNQDTQSCFASQEVNVMIDSERVCKDWLAAIRRNQNTHLYGAVSQEDGIWRDEHGKEAEGAMGVNVGHFAWAKGIIGAVQRVRGAGGF